MHYYGIYCLPLTGSIVLRLGRVKYSAQFYLKLLLLASYVGLKGLYAAEMGTAFLIVVFLVMLASHHLLISLAQLFLQQVK